MLLYWVRPLKHDLGCVCIARVLPKLPLTNGIVFSESLAPAVRHVYSRRTHPKTKSTSGAIGCVSIARVLPRLSVTNGIVFSESLAPAVQHVYSRHADPKPKAPAVRHVYSRRTHPKPKAPAVRHVYSRPRVPQNQKHQRCDRVCSIARVLPKLSLTNGIVFSESLAPAVRHVYSNRTRPKPKAPAVRHVYSNRTRPKPKAPAVRHVYSRRACPKPKASAVRFGCVYIARVLPKLPLTNGIVFLRVFSTQRCDMCIAAARAQNQKHQRCDMWRESLALVTCRYKRTANQQRYFIVKSNIV